MTQTRFNHRRPARRFPQSKNAQYDVLRAIQSTQNVHQEQHVEAPVEQKITNTFETFGLHPELVKNILSKGYTLPTPIQDQAIQPILDGRDLIGIANTGTGKTAAFLIPLIQKIATHPNEKCIVLTPTRELAVQINTELREFADGSAVRSVLCTGGTNVFNQRRDLMRPYNFLIGTPGRVKDVIQQQMLSLTDFHTVVLDEADRMVDIGFIADVKYFISLLPKDRQSLFFSATVSDKVREILAMFVKNPVTVSVKKQETASSIKQDIIKVANKQKKVDQLHDLLNQEGFDKVLIFGRTKWGIQKLTDELISRGFKAGAIHGNKRQSQRQFILEQFKSSKIQILLATDVASRGLDIHDVSHVINYDMPATYDDYVHRIGRTGRANKQGIALTFVD